MNSLQLSLFKGEVDGVSPYLLHTLLHFSRSSSSSYHHLVIHLVILLLLLFLILLLRLLLYLRLTLFHSFPLSDSLPPPSPSPSPTSPPPPRPRPSPSSLSVFLSLTSLLQTSSSFYVCLCWVIHDLPSKKRSQKHGLFSAQRFFIAPLKSDASCTMALLARLFDSSRHLSAL